MKQRQTLTLLILTLLILTLTAMLTALPSLAAPLRLTADPEATEVTFLLDATGHDVEGTMVLQSADLELDPADGHASGEIVIDATRTDTGSEKRDKTMHRKVLESHLYPRIVFTAERFTGELAEGAESTLEVQGTVAIDGEEHPFSLPLTLAVNGETFKAQATLVVPYVEWGMHDPSMFILKVAKEVQVVVAATGAVKRVEAAAVAAKSP